MQPLSFPTPNKASAHTLTPCPSKKAQALARSLEFHACLAELLLPYNHIGFAGAAALLNNSSKCPTLATLDLSHNVLGRMRTACLYPALHRFHLTHKQTVPANFDFEAMLAAAARCTALRSLHLACNHITEPELDLLQGAWGRERSGLSCLDRHPPVTPRERTMLAP